MKDQQVLSYLSAHLKDVIKEPISYHSSYEELLKIVLYQKKTGRQLLIVKENDYEARRFYENLLSFISEDRIALYLPEESMRSEAIITSFENRHERLLALYKIFEKQVDFIIITPYGLMRHLPKKGLLEKAILNLKVGLNISLKGLIDNLNDLGYEKVLRVEAPLSYASRGAIIDVFSINYPYPLRIEFFDDEIDSLRFFDINTQRTIQTLDEAKILFASDILIDQEELALLKSELANYDTGLDLEYLEKHIYSGALYYYYAFLKSSSHLLDYIEDFYIYESDKDLIKSHIANLKDETYAYLRQMSEDRDLPLRFYVFASYEDELLKHHKYLKSSPYSEVFALFDTLEEPKLPLDKKLLFITSTDEKIIIALKEVYFNETAKVLDELGLEYSTKITDQKITLLKEDLFFGFKCDKLKLKVYTQKELFAPPKIIGRFARKYEEATKLDSYEELEKGDYVVHNQYGIGQYMGIEKREVNGITLDYLKIIYRENAELLVPLAQFGLVRKYVSKDGVVPKLHKLGSKEWQKTKEKVEANVNDLAERLVYLYANREEKIGFAFSKDNDIQKEFDAKFDYELTKDQVKAIEEVKSDMESSKPMDRLLCGDVGFGKTEVAIEASMKAVLDHKQVAYLCPTTILSMQHYATFKERFKDYPVNIRLLNRFVDSKTIKDTITKLKSGQVDILIGTHRLLSKDVVYKDLGLLIIDEEQRFGVEQKERIKELKQSIDVLSLSATPIPRTLQMSLVGLRGLSTLDTPPHNRYPIQTYVVEKDESLLLDVIKRELSRKGQVFYLHNNVDEIYLLANKINRKLPDAKIMVAHGKMNSEELDAVMLEFYEGRADVLICTTIIETGIDIPNANTIIINNAQNFGLSQLYQIRGRVGRSDRIAYAYFVVPKRKQLNEDSQKRLKAIKEFTALGSGYKIAMRDLAIRGAGDMLGAKQSGFIDNVGLDLYLAMLKKAINEKRGIKEEPKEEKVKAPIVMESYIPDNFSDNDYEKLNLYQRLEKIENHDDLWAYYLEVSDEFGHLPKQVAALFEKKKLELFVEDQILDSVKIKNHRLEAIMSKKYSDHMDGMKLFEYCAELSKDIRIKYIKNSLEFSFPDPEGRKHLFALLENLKELEKHAS